MWLQLEVDSSLPRLLRPHQIEMRPDQSWPCPAEGCWPHAGSAIRLVRATGVDALGVTCAYQAFSHSIEAFSHST